MYYVVINCVNNVQVKFIVYCLFMCTMVTMLYLHLCCVHGSCSFTYKCSVLCFINILCSLNCDSVAQKYAKNAGVVDDGNCLKALKSLFACLSYSIRIYNCVVSVVLNSHSIFVKTIKLLDFLCIIATVDVCI